VLPTRSPLPLRLLDDGRGCLGPVLFFALYARGTIVEAKRKGVVPYVGSGEVSVGNRWQARVGDSLYGDYFGMRAKFEKVQGSSLSPAQRHSSSS